MEDQQLDCQSSMSQSWQLIITLNVPESAIIKIEALDQSGKRYDVPESGLGALVGEYEVAALHPVDEPDDFFEFHDANDDFELDDDIEEFGDDLGPVAVRRTGSRRLITRQTKMSILGHLLQQKFLRSRCEDACPSHWEVVLSVRMAMN